MPFVGGKRSTQPFFLLALSKLLPEEVILSFELFDFHEIAFFLIKLARGIGETAFDVRTEGAEVLKAHGGVDSRADAFIVFHHISLLL